jgi:uncharacterized protein YfaS (alpha-2-macroglobulin family)
MSRGEMSKLSISILCLALLVSGCRDTRKTPDVRLPTEAAKKTATADQHKEAPLNLIPWTGKPGPGWKDFDQKVNEDKFEEAAKLAESMLEQAKAEKNTEEWVRALIRNTQLRIGLHGFETAVRFIKEQPWPDDLLSQTVLNLYFGHSLVAYGQAYSWEINKREKVESKGTIDLKAWTMEQIYGEAHKAYQVPWNHREQLSNLPNTMLSEYVAVNDYPAGIRSTLRDTLSYLFVELLADTTGWRPEHSNQIFELNLKALLGREGQAIAEQAALSDTRLHPLIKIVSILNDLETWHAGRSETAAQFEARLTRLSVLQSNFTDASDRALIQKDLEERLPSVRDHEWWAVGMAQLAQFVQAEDTPDNLIRARAIAEAGQKAYPDSVGGRRCLHLIKSIEAPDYRLEAMASDSAGKPSIGVTAKNLSTLTFRAYVVDLKKQIESVQDYNLYPESQQIEKLLRSKPTHEWTAELPATPDFKMHRTMVTPPMQKPGFYVVIASAKKDFDTSDNEIHATYQIIGDLVLVSQQESGEIKVTTVSGSRGAPVAGVEVFLYRFDWQRKHHVIDTKITDKDGTAIFSQGGDHGPFFFFARKGSEIAIDPQQVYLYRDQPRQDEYRTLIFTDRSIYRPMQKIFWKAMVYHGRDDRTSFQTAPAEKVTISLMDPNGQQVESKTVTTNAFGTASGEFVIPTGRILGTWYLQSSLIGNAAFQVEEYKRPTFETKLLDPEKDLRLNKPATLKGEARYYFGLPVQNGTVKWHVVREPLYPWWWSYYSWSGGSATKKQTVASGISTLKEDGSFILNFTPEADERLSETTPGITYRYSVTAAVTDEGGETRSASRDFRLGFVAVEATASFDGEFLIENRPSELSVMRTNLDGAPAAGEGSYRILALVGPREALMPADQPLPRPPESKNAVAYRTPGDDQRPRWNPGYQPEAILRQWADGAEKINGTLKHDISGKATLKVPALPAGAYRLHYATTDAYGSRYTMSQEFVVAGSRTNLPLPAIVRLEKSSVLVGETARILVHSGLANQTLFFDIYQAGRRIERRILQSDRDGSLIEIPVTEKQRGGFAIMVWAERDHQFMSFDLSIFVPWDNQQLSVEFSTFRDKLRPGQQETLTVKVAGSSKKTTAAAAAEILAYMYDRSLDAFAPHYPPTPISLFPNRATAGVLRESGGSAQTGWVECRGFKPPPDYPALQKDHLTFYEDYGIGGPGYRRAEYSSLRDGVARPSKMVAQPMMAPPSPAPAGEPMADKETKAVSKKKDMVSSAAEAQGRSGTGESEKPVQLRSEFAETAFWRPHLLTGADGSVSFEFKVPDSVTSWSVWAHAITKDLKSGSVNKETRTIKDLMVRPYLPRFLREGDQAELKIVVNNASEKEMRGTLTFDIIDPATEKSILDTFGIKGAAARTKPFTVAAGVGTNLSFAITAPSKVQTIAFKVIATSGDFSDGELRPIPILPGRMHLAQSRFVTLKDKARREMKFADLASNDDPSLINEQLVVTIDAQLFYSVLSALPYLVNYPYECTEQTSNRFISTGILSSMYKDYPAIAKMAKELSSRTTQFEQWDQPDPNRKMTLEESPWLLQAKGGKAKDDDLLNVLNPAVAKAQRDSALQKLQKAQTSLGGFPWFPGGPPSPFITVYLLHGFSKGLEFGVDVPKDMIQRAWAYLHQHYVDTVVREMMGHDCCWEIVTFLNYVLSNYPDASWTGGVFTDAERHAMLDFSFRHWKQHSPYLKGYLALTLKRAGRAKDASLVWESVMDSAKTAEDQGTFWAPEDRSWLWYNDTIETHAFAVRTEMELMPNDPKLDGLVLWLLLNKKMNHWKSTRATAEVIYSLAHYLKTTNQLGVREEATVTVGPEQTKFVFEPDRYTGKKNQIVIPGDMLDPKTSSTVVVEKDTKGLLFASATWHFSTERLPAEARGDYLQVSRSYFRRANNGKEFVLEPLKEGARVKVGDEVEVQISLRSKHPMEYVHLRDPRAAGFEPENAVSQHRWDLGIYWYEEIRDSGTNFFFEHLPQGEYTFKYRIRAATAGVFKVASATVQPMYAPEFYAYSAGTVIGIQPLDK